jgi:formylmethanofuran dehydrogenase subunit E
MEYKLKVFKQEAREGWSYRFAVVNKSKTYPANFVCMLPLKLSQEKNSNKGLFGTFFGEKSVETAVELLNDSLKTEQDADVIAEIEKRLKLIDPKLANLVRCSQCKKEFQLKKEERKYKRALCSKCLTQVQNKKYHPNV